MKLDSLQDIYHSPSLSDSHYLSLAGDFFLITEKKPSKSENRKTLSKVYDFCVLEALPIYRTGGLANRAAREVWTQVCQRRHPKDLPKIIGEDGFLRMYSEGEPLTVFSFRSIWMKLYQKIVPRYQEIEIGGTQNFGEYYDVTATPPGLFPKLFSYFRIKMDPELLRQVQSDLCHANEIKDLKKRKILSLAILSHGAAYRELDGQILRIPSFLKEGVLIPYAFRHHLIWEGVKTISASPLEREHEEPGIYLCQGTEIWPSQPSMLSTLFANLGKEGPASEPYAHSWRQIHKHLRTLKKEEGPLPIVIGHSLGGALATQICLYSHPLLSEAFAFNPPGVEERDYKVYHRLSPSIQQKFKIFANLDDLPFWRIGTKVIGKITVLFSSIRWKYRPIQNWELFLIVPALIKTTLNLFFAFPAHQNIYLLTENYLSISLTDEEIQKENIERVGRPDHLYFFSKLHGLIHFLLKFVRKHFRWARYEDYLRSQIEILELHEQDLKETLAFEDGRDLTKELDMIQKEKADLEEKLRQLKK